MTKSTPLKGRLPGAKTAHRLTAKWAVSPLNQTFSPAGEVTGRSVPRASGGPHAVTQLVHGLVDPGAQRGERVTGDGRGGGTGLGELLAGVEPPVAELFDDGFHLLFSVEPTKMHLDLELINTALPLVELGVGQLLAGGRQLRLQLGDPGLEPGDAVLGDVLACHVLPPHRCTYPDQTTLGPLAP